MTKQKGFIHLDFFRWAVLLCIGIGVVLSSVGWLVLYWLFIY